MAEKGNRKLVDMNLREFMDETASESPAPGGGSISAYLGALGVALGTMVANLSSHKKGWDDRWKEFSGWAVRGKEIQNRLLELVDKDTEAFNRIMEAYALPKKTEEEKQLRKNAVQQATKTAIMVPLAIMETAFSGFTLLREMVEKGSPSSVTDAGVGALALRSCIKGAFLNVKVNAAGLDDKVFSNKVIIKGSDIERKAVMEEEIILEIVNSKITRQ
jgi:Methenyl tetrahydrofolate cyclohydrolase